MTERALAPLPLDIQRVLTAPLGGGIRLEKTVGNRSLDAGATSRVTLTVANDGIAAEHEVVVRDRSAAPLSYLRDSTTLDGNPIRDVGGGMPTFQGPAGVGLNIGSVGPHSSRRITYRVKAASNVASTTRLPILGSISTREAVTPAPANAPQLTNLRALANEIGRIPGIKTADPLVFVDMATGSISAHGANVPGPVKLFAFDAKYQAHYPSIKMLSGSVRSDGAVISAETAHILHVSLGDVVTLKLPGSAKPLSLKVSGITDLSRATPLFSSREASSLEQFLYVSYTIVVSPHVYRSQVAPAYENAVAARDANIKALPLEELDIGLDHAKLQSDPAAAVAQTVRIGEDVLSVASAQDYLVDNVSNTLQVAKGDAAVAKRMFIFLGLPGAILAAILTAYAGTLLAEAQRRESALLRVRGAKRRHLLHLLALRTIAIAGIGSMLGAALGFASMLVLLGRSILFAASSTALLQSALIGIVAGMLVTALALYLPGRRLITQEINQELAVLSHRANPGWKRLRLDFVALVAAGIAQIVAIRLGAFKAPPGSVYAGQSVSLPLQLLIAPTVAWLAGTLLISDVLQVITARASRRSGPQFGPLLSGLLRRSITRRLTAVTGGVVTVGLVVGLGTMLACFATIYDKAKVADARFLAGSDIRLTPNPASGAAHPTNLTTRLRGAGVTGATAVVFSRENAVLTTKSNEDVATLAAIDPRAFTKISAMQNSLFVDGPVSQMMATLEKHPDGVLVNTALADGLKLKTGDPVQALLGRGTDKQIRKHMKVVGLFTQFPGAPKGTDIVANLNYYQHTTGLTAADYYLVSTTDRSVSGLNRAVHSLSTLPRFAQRFDVQTSATTLDKDQSSLTALNVRGLLHLDSFYTFLMAATATAMFVFGLLLQRRREYVTLRAQGLQSREIRRLVLTESGISSTLGTVIGVLVGIAMASQFVRVLRPIFTLPPPLEVPAFELGILAALVLGATALSSAAAALLIGRLKPTELLRDE